MSPVPDVRGRSRVRIRLCVALVFWRGCSAEPSNAYAWEFLEHQKIGVHAFNLACQRFASALLAGDSRLQPKGQKIKRDKRNCSQPEEGRMKKLCDLIEQKNIDPLQLAYGAAFCGQSPSDFLSSQKGVPSYRVHQSLSLEALRALPQRPRALLFGQTCAVAGDHLGRPEEFLDSKRPARAVNIYTYLALALRNHSHFHPAAIREWRKFAREAMNCARGMGVCARGQGYSVEHTIERVTVFAGFGSHFLQDAFAAGHMGFNRPASSATAAKGLHDRRNRSGVCVANLSQKRWRTWGDGHLKNCQGDEDCYVNLVNTNALFIEDVMRSLGNLYSQSVEPLTQYETVEQSMPWYFRPNEGGDCSLFPIEAGDSVLVLREPAEAGFSLGAQYMTVFGIGGDRVLHHAGLVAAAPVLRVSSIGGLRFRLGFGSRFGRPTADSSRYWGEASSEVSIEHPVLFGGAMLLEAPVASVRLVFTRNEIYGEGLGGIRVSLTFGYFDLGLGFFLGRAFASNETHPVKIVSVMGLSVPLTFSGPEAITGEME